MFIYGILAMSLDILVGYSGLPCFGSAGFFGTAAYVVAVLSTRHGVGFWGCSVSALLLTTGVAAVFGLLVAHSSGVFFMMISFSLGMVLWGLAFRWASMTGGDNGISEIPRPDLGLPLNLNDPVTFYLCTLAVFFLILWALRILVRSPFGQSLRGIRESESRMRALGYNCWLHKYAAYVISGAFAGLAGVLWAYYNAFVGPSNLDLPASFEAFLMVVLGGPGTLFGSAIGAGIILFLKNFLSAYTHRYLIFLGFIYILIVFYAPKGLVNLVIRTVKGKDQEDTAFSIFL
jgi:branched-chain amino acid transport system permease protein